MYLALLDDELTVQLAIASTVSDRVDSQVCCFFRRAIRLNPTTENTTQLCFLKFRTYIWTSLVKGPPMNVRGKLYTYNS